MENEMNQLMDEFRQRGYLMSNSFLYNEEDLESWLKGGEKMTAKQKREFMRLCEKVMDVFDENGANPVVAAMRELFADVEERTIPTKLKDNKDGTFTATLTRKALPHGRKDIEVVLREDNESIDLGGDLWLDVFKSDPATTDGTHYGIVSVPNLGMISILRFV